MLEPLLLAGGRRASRSKARGVISRVKDRHPAFAPATSRDPGGHKLARAPQLLDPRIFALRIPG
jgi:hypothetical protein